jgi:hypothetical protein
MSFVNEKWTFLYPKLTWPLPFLAFFASKLKKIPKLIEREDKIS